MYLPNDKVFTKEILKQTHESRFVVHPGGIKMYKDFKEFYWWSNINKKIAKYVAQYRICQQVKVEHQKPKGTLQSLLILEQKWEDITIDFVFGLSRGKRGNDVILVVVDQLTKSVLLLPMKMMDPADKLARL